MQCHFFCRSGKILSCKPPTNRDGPPCAELENQILPHPKPHESLQCNLGKERLTVDPDSGLTYHVAGNANIENKDVIPGRTRQKRPVCDDPVSINKHLRPSTNSEAENVHTLPDFNHALPVNDTGCDPSNHSSSGTNGHIAPNLPSCICPTQFSGDNTTNARLWLLKFENYAGLMQWTGDTLTNIFPLFLDGPALVWYDSLLDTEKASFLGLKQAFLHRYVVNEASQWEKSDIFQNALNRKLKV